MELSLDTIWYMAINLIMFGAFYGAIKVEIVWIKKTLDRNEKLVEKLEMKLERSTT